MIKKKTPYYVCAKALVSILLLCIFVLLVNYAAYQKVRLTSSPTNTLNLVSKLLSIFYKKIMLEIEYYWRKMRKEKQCRERDLWTKLSSTKGFINLAVSAELRKGQTYSEMFCQCNFRYLYFFNLITSMRSEWRVMVGNNLWSGWISYIGLFRTSSYQDVIIMFV